MNVAVTELKKPKRTVRTPHIEIRMAEAKDAAMIAAFLGSFFKLSIWSEFLAYHEERTRKYLEVAVGTEFAMYVVAMDGEEMVGVCSYHIFSVYTEPIAVMDETYTIPRFRRTDLGRRLVGLVIELARRGGCKVINFPICSGLKEQNSLMNMIGKHFGAVPVGMIFRKAL